MRNSKAKQIREIFGISKDKNPILRRTYRRFKKFYSRTPNNRKAQILQIIQKQFNQTT